MKLYGFQSWPPGVWRVAILIHKQMFHHRHPHPMRYSHFMYNTYPIPTASLVTMKLFERTLWGWGKCCTWNDCTSSGGVNSTSDPSSVTTFKIISNRGIGSRKCSFPAKCVWIFDDETFTEVRKWWGFSFAWKNRGWDGFSRRKPPLSWLRELTVEILVCCLDFVLGREWQWFHGMPETIK